MRRDRCSHLVSRPVLLGLVTWAAADLAAQAVGEVDADPRVAADIARFEHLSPRDQKRTLDAVRAAVAAIDDPYLTALRKIAADAPALSSKAKLEVRTKKGKSSRKSQGRAQPTAEQRSFWQELPFPVEQEYAFGFARTFTPRLPPVKGRTAAQSEAIARHDELLALLHGYPPEIDDALAVLLARLDHDRSADQLSRLLEAWHNGSESFYHALDRTAGTPEAVFFFDAMLDDFIVRCVPTSHPDYKAIRRSLQRAHDALHDSFLAYRQYRAFREAIALSLLLPPDQRLPPTLSRYETAPKGQYSLRQQIGMLLLAAHEDLAIVVSQVVAGAAPLSAALWSEKYDPYPAWNDLFDGRRAEVGRLAEHMDLVPGLQEQARRGVQSRIADAAHAALVAHAGTGP